MKNKIISIIQIALSVCLVGAVKFWAPACTGMLKLAKNGGQIHMKCWFSSQAVFALAVVMVIIAAASLFMGKWSTRMAEIAIVVASVMCVLMVTFFIGICTKAGMPCHKMFIWVIGLSAVNALFGVMGLFGGGTKVKEKVIVVGDKDEAK